MNEHELFIKKIRIRKRLIHLFRISLLVILIIIWEVLARFNTINTFLFSSPSMIINTIINNNFFKHIFITIIEVLISFSLASILGLIIAGILWSNKFIADIIDPYLTILNSLPKVALGPLIIIWIGASYKSIIFMALLISLFLTIINIYHAFINTDNNYITLMKSFGASKKQIFFKVILPSNLGSIMNTLKINISMSLIGVIMGELLVSKAGLGYLIMYGSQVFNINLVITSVIILLIISYLMYYLMEKLEIILINKK